MFIFVWVDHVTTHNYVVVYSFILLLMSVGVVSSFDPQCKTNCHEYSIVCILVNGCVHA